MIDWAGEEHVLFRSCAWWKQNIGEHPAIASADFFELTDGDAAWEDWFASGHKYALSDKIAFERGVAQHMTFVGISIQKKC